jgi:hypothetical protein
MAGAGLPWSALRPLRPVLIAGAVAVAWLSFSAPGADASNSSTSESPLGEITATVSSLSTGVDNAVDVIHHAQNVADPVGETLPDPAAVVIPEPAPAAPLPQPDPQTPAPETAVLPAVVAPVVDEIAIPLETVVGILPAAEVLPAEAVAPVASQVDAAVSGVVETVVQPVTETVPVDQVIGQVPDLHPDAPALNAPVGTPVVEAVKDLVTVPESSTGPPLTPAATSVATSVATERTDGAGLSAQVRPGYAPLVTAVASSEIAPSHLGGAGHAGHKNASGSSPALPSGGGTPGGDSTRSPDALLPSTPSGSGSGQSSGGPSTSAAWLTSPFEYLPLTGIVPASGPLQHVPSPVAIDPGSSPD